jgi:glycosyltransferase involved in cell wall biosynthesis
VRIVLNALVIAPGLAGDRVYCEQLLGALAAAGGHEYVVFVRQDTDLPDIPTDRVRVVRAPVSGGSTFGRAAWEYRTFPGEAAGLSADLVHGLGGRSPRSPGRPFVLTVHDLIYRQYPESVPLLNRAFMRWVQPRVARQADRVIVPSRSTAEQVVALLGVRPERVRVVPLGGGRVPGAAPDEPAVARVLAALGCRHPYVLNVGRGYAHKNLPGLVRAFAHLRRLGHGDTQLVLAGEQHQASRGVDRLIAELGVAGRVVRTGFVGTTELRALYAGAAAFAFPSLAEGFGLPVLEAMACGAPVVASAASAIPEVVGDAGVLARADDPPAFAEALACVLGDERLRRDLRTRGRDRAREFTWERCAAATIDVYRELA